MLTAFYSGKKYSFSVPPPSQTAKSAPREEPAKTVSVTSVISSNGYTDIEASNMRRTIAKRLLQSKVRKSRV